MQNKRRGRHRTTLTMAAALTLRREIFPGSGDNSSPLNAKRVHRRVQERELSADPEDDAIS
jgi:hypothetical protein